MDAQNAGAAADEHTRLLVDAVVLTKAFEDALKAQAKSGVGSWYGVLFTTGSTLGSFFAGFTLGIVSSTADSENDHDKEAGGYAAASSLLFVVTVLVCSACSLGYAFHSKMINEKMEETGGRHFGFTTVQLLMTGLSILMQEVMLAAILFFFLVMRVYARTTGNIGISFTAVFMAVAGVVWFLQSFQQIGWVGKLRSNVGKIF